MLSLTFTEGDVKSFETTVALEMQSPIKHFEKELAAIRTGRASTKLLEDIPVECYGSSMKMREVASIGAPDARMLTVQPWDKTLIEAIEKAILGSDVGVTPVNDGEMIRLQLPQMSSARRDELIKLLGKKAEE
ncbi:MAG: ribosome-recycling factor, partial [Candidatus Dependentiae bacterium]